MLVALLVGLGFGQVAADAFVFAEEGLAVVFQPVQHLLDVILEQTKRQLLVQLNLLLAPLLLQLSVKTKKKKEKKTKFQNQSNHRKGREHKLPSHRFRGLFNYFLK